MFTFKDYLVEAQFSEDDLARVIGVFERRLPKLLGTKIYRYGGKGHVMEFGGFSEILYLFGERAFGVRFKGIRQLIEYGRRWARLLNSPIDRLNFSQEIVITRN